MAGCVWHMTGCVWHMAGSDDISTCGGFKGAVFKAETLKLGLVVLMVNGDLLQIPNFSVN